MRIGQTVAVHHIELVESTAAPEPALAPEVPAEDPSARPR